MEIQQIAWWDSSQLQSSRANAPEISRLHQFWTKFFDNGTAEVDLLDASTIWIEAPQCEATGIFRSLFSIDPEYVSCDCCGPAYAIEDNARAPSGDDYSVGFYVLSKKDLDNNPHLTNRLTVKEVETEIKALTLAKWRVHQR